MAEDDPDARSLGAALSVRTQIVRGAIAGTLLSGGLFTFFVAIPGADRSALWYFALAFVVAVTSGGLVTLALIAYRVHRLVTRDGPSARRQP